MRKPHFVFDFDSTFIRLEALDVLCEMIHGSRQPQRLIDIQHLTQLGMEGKLSLKESLLKRIELLEAHRDHLPLLIDRLRQEVTASVKRNRRFFQEYSEQVYVISNGFSEIITPIVAEFGIRPERVMANTFRFDNQGAIVGFDERNPLCDNKGKAIRLQMEQLQGEVVVIGDGYTDYEMREAGAATRFYAFSENVARPVVMAKADHIAPSLDEILFDLQFKASVSYPKNRIKVLLLENVHPDAVAILQSEGYTVEVLSKALDEETLCQKIANVSILGIRSKTQVTERVLQHARKLMAIGTFCIGTNQVNLLECSRRGIAVFNAPYSNTRSVVELALGSIIMLLRGVTDKNKQLHQGLWDKSAAGSCEIRGKKLGIVGYGNIGSQLSVVAEALGMEVYFYDLTDKLALGNARKCISLQQLLACADVVSLHVDGRKENHHLIDAQALNTMKSGAILLNLSRGHVVDVDALARVLQSGKLKGAAVDVFPEEPHANGDPFESPLMGLHNTILTPHIGGSTEEAQCDIGHFVAQKLMNYVNTGSTMGSVNLPEIQLPELHQAHRIMHIHENVRGILAQINTILAESDNNILGQYLKTNEEIGYVITDIDNVHNDTLERRLKNIPNTIKYRVLY
ncbi:MAG TPA: phosphoglycerate dehydrogenase [Luteibaculaceae bacterium]|nr:phosphoglycerate dehydrogenase [Luteibaculaceae bacterium]